MFTDTWASLIYNAREVTDSERALEALKGFEGKRLTYKGSYGQN